MTQTEYSKYRELKGDKKSYIRIPSSLLTMSENDKEFLVLLYILFFKGINNRVNLSLKLLTTFYGFNIRNKQTVTQFRNALLFLLEKSFIKFDVEELDTQTDKYFEIYVYSDRICKDVDTSYYAMLYYDELLSFIKYKAKGMKFNISAALMIYCYFKMIIPKRPNTVPLIHESLSINEYQKELPEAFNCYVYDVAEAVNITPYTVSRVIGILKDMSLIDYRIVQRWKNDNKWKRQHIIFSLMEKREKGFLYHCGDSYSNREIQNKYDLLVKKKVIQSLKGRK